MGTLKRYSPEVRDRAVRMVMDHRGEFQSQWAAIQSVASKLGFTAETLRLQYVGGRLRQTIPKKCVLPD